MLFLISVGCGTPGAPQPPSLNLAKPVSDLKAVRIGNQVNLTWTVPTHTTDNATFRHRGETKIDLSGIYQLHGDRRELSSYATNLKAIAPDVVLDMIPYTEEDARDLMRVFKGIVRRVVAISITLLPADSGAISSAIETIVREYAAGRRPIASDRQFIDEFDARSQARVLDSRLRALIAARRRSAGGHDGR